MTEPSFFHNPAPPPPLTSISMYFLWCRNNDTAFIMHSYSRKAANPNFVYNSIDCSKRSKTSDGSILLSFLNITNAFKNRWKQHTIKYSKRIDWSTPKKIRNPYWHCYLNEIKAITICTSPDGCGKYWENGTLSNKHLLITSPRYSRSFHRLHFGIQRRRICWQSGSVLVWAIPLMTECHSVKML